MAPETKVTQMLAVYRGVVLCKQQNMANKKGTWATKQMLQRCK